MILGIGSDVIEIERMTALLSGDSGAAKALKIFTQHELDFCEGRLDRADRLAARFAAKEAALKALGTGWAKGLKLSEVEVWREEEEAPSLRFYGAALARFEAIGGKRAWVSLSHDAGIAFAMVVVEGETA